MSFFFFFSEKETWKTESETMKEEKKKLESQIQQDTIKVKEYNVGKTLLKSIYSIIQTKIARSTSNINVPLCRICSVLFRWIQMK